jgi:Zn-dependent protease
VRSIHLGRRPVVFDVSAGRIRQAAPPVVAVAQRASLTPVLRFRLGEVPVGIHFSFLVVAFLAPRDYAGAELVVWTAMVGLAVLAHEAGHAFTVRAFGARRVSITLFALGGVTTWPVGAGLSAGRRFLVAAAGSAVGIALGAPVYWAWQQGVFDDSRWLSVAAYSFAFPSFVWGVLNWVPIRPLDGGQMLTSALEIPFPKRGESVAMVLSFLFGLAAVLLLLNYDQLPLAIFVGVIVLVGMRPEPRPQEPQQPPPQAPRPEPAPRQPHERPGWGSRTTPPSRRPQPPDDADPPAFPI